MSFVKIISIFNPLNGHYLYTPFVFQCEIGKKIKGPYFVKIPYYKCKLFFANSPGPALSENHSGQKFPVALGIIHTLHFFPNTSAK